MEGCYDFSNFGGQVQMIQRLQVKLSLCLTKHYTMKEYAGVDV
jgi:hypothetical protein